MKTIRLIVPALLFAAALFAQVEYWRSEPTNPPPAVRPRWLLMHRYWGQVSTQQGDMISVSPGWINLTETFDTTDQLKRRLDELVKQSGMVQSHLIGLWQLSDLTRVSLEISTTEKLIPERIEQRKEIERHWNASIQLKD